MDDAAASDTKQQTKRRAKKPLVIVAACIILAAAGGGYFFMNAAKTAEAAVLPAPVEAQEGKTVRLAPLTVNLTDGRVLKVGIALGMAKEPKNEELALLTKTESKPGKDAGKIAVSPLAGLETLALNEAIMTLGDKTYDELSKPGGRAQAKEELAKKIKAAYEGDVVAVYFTEFVMA